MTEADGDRGRKGKPCTANFRRFGRKWQDFNDLGVTPARLRMPKCPKEDSPDNRRGCLLILLRLGLIAEDLDPYTLP
ncbi:MAG TPA: hypothetical protein VLK88_07945, partial [Gemmatimonadales bacterium]|nr:hypothetical protein [Gemmatimonadales bacterium]